MPGKMARSDPRPSARVTRGAGSGQHLASVLQERRENGNIDAGLGFIWRISDITSDTARLIGEAGAILLGYPFVILVFGGRARLLDLTLLLRGAFRRAPRASLNANA
jgi:hypothetical protein